MWMSSPPALAWGPETNYFYQVRTRSQGHIQKPSPPTLMVPTLFGHKTEASQGQGWATIQYSAPPNCGGNSQISNYSFSNTHTSYLIVQNTTEIFIGFFSDYKSNSQCRFLSQRQRDKSTRSEQSGLRDICWVYYLVTIKKQCVSWACKNSCARTFRSLTSDSQKKGLLVVSTSIF